MASALWQKARDAVRRDLWRPGTQGVPDATVDECLHSALKDVEAERRWLWLEQVRQSDTFSDDKVSLPPNCGSISSIAIIRPDGKTRDILEREQLDRVRYLSQTVASGSWPCSYAVSGQTIYIDAKANAGSRLEIVYTAETPDDVDAAAAEVSNAALEKHFKCVCALACSYVAATYLKDDAEAGRMATAHQRMLDRMIEQDEAEQTDNQGSMVRPDTYYYDLARGYG